MSHYLHDDFSRTPVAKDPVIGATLIMLVIKLVEKIFLQTPTVVPETLVTVERSLAGVVDDTK